MAGTFLCTGKAWVDAGLVRVDDGEGLGLTPDRHIAREGLLGGVERNLLVPAWCRPRSYLHFIFGSGVGKLPSASRASWVARDPFLASTWGRASFASLGVRPDLSRVDTEGWQLTGNNRRGALDLLGGLPRWFDPRRAVASGSGCEADRDWSGR